MRWFERAHQLQELFDDGLPLEARSLDDREAIKRAADEMVEVARHVKGRVS